MKKILIIDSVHPAIEEILSANGFLFTDATLLTLSEILEIIDSYSGIVIRSRFVIDKDFLDCASSLKFIARAGAGMENIDVKYAEAKGISCINAPEGNRDAVGEHALAMLLALFNKIIVADAEVRNGIWKREENRGSEIQGKTIGIIGFGNMGSAFAKRLQGFDAEILVYDKYITIDSLKNPFVKQVELESIFIKADVLSLHVPLNVETKYMVNEAFLKCFYKSIYLVNTSRGKVVDTEVLVQFMKSGKVLGACLDVIEYESVSFENVNWEHMPEAWKYLIKSKDVVLSPHIGGWSFESHRKISEVMAHKILDLSAKNNNG